MKFLLGLVPNLAPGLAAFANPWVLLGALAVAAACFGLGVRVEGWRWDASLTTEANDRANELVKKARENAALAAGLQKQLVAERAKRDKDRQKFEEERARVPKANLVEVDCPKPDAVAAQPRARLSPDAIRLWNSGLGIGLPEAYGRWGVDDPVPAAGAPRLGGSR